MLENIGIILLLLMGSMKLLAANKPCAMRETKNGIICVCNSTYCDTFELVENPGGDVFVQYTSNKAGKRFEINYGLFNKQSTCGEGMGINVDRSVELQKIYGFGGAFTDAAGINILSLSQKSQENLLRSYFSTGGIEYNFGRVCIGGSDFSTHPYTLDDVNDDFKLDNFNLTKEDHLYKIPLIREAMKMSRREIHLMGSAWSAPAWMKTNNKLTGFGFLKKEFYSLWADYHIRFLEAYKVESLNFWAITTGNEPSNVLLPIFVKFNSMGWTPSQQSKWIARDLGPKIRSSDFKALKIITLDDQRPVLPFWALKINSYKNSSDYFDGFGLHWYYDRVTPPSLLDWVHHKYPNKFLMNTEACEGYLPWSQHVLLGSWERGQSYMESIMQDINHWMSGWIDWNLALDEKGSPNWVENFVDSPIIVNASSDEFYKQPMFYAIGHFSKFIQPNAIKIGITTVKSEKDVAATAAYNADGSVVIVIHNRGSSQRCLTLNDPTKGQAEVNLTPHSFNTIMYWPK